jgi:hypothetical protein
MVMQGTGRARPLIAVAAACVLALAVGWVVDRLGLALAFSTGAVFATVVGLASMATTPAIRLMAVTSEPSDGWQEFHRELNRARRFDRPFGIVRFVGVGRGVMTERHVRDQLATLARRIDRVWLDGGDLFVLLPESDAAAVETAVARARYRLGEPLDVVVTATFPANGITSGSLIACLYQGDASPVAIGALAPASPALTSMSSPDSAELVETAT